jgi:glucose dehydrogenase
MLTFGSTAGELATQGKIFGVEAATGKKAWEFNTIKQDPKSWPDEAGKFGGGGAWMPGTYDAETDTVFYGTGNPGKDFINSDREGDNLYTDSIVALDPRTGNLKWYRQEIKQDVWDYDSPYEVMLFKKGGKDLIVHMNKSGYVFVLDKNNGNIENIWPISDVKNDFGRLVMAPDGRRPGRLVANDPITGQRKWSYEMDVPGFACVLTTGGSLVFNGDPMGILRAFDADTGKVLWSFNTGSGMRSGIISYAIDGEQYILVPSGWGSYAAILLPPLFPQLENVPAASTLIAFKLAK